MVGLEGQNSVDPRGILIHPALSPGTPSSLGCSGISYGEFCSLKSEIGYGSLVYNYFGSTPAPAGCSNTSGLIHNGMCRPDPGAPAIPAEATGVSASAQTACQQRVATGHAANTSGPTRRYINRGSRSSGTIRSTK
jgi:hypothetical protein